MSDRNLIFFPGYFIREYNQDIHRRVGENGIVNRPIAFVQFNYPISSEYSNVNYKWYVSPTNTLDTNTAILLTDRDETTTPNLYSKEVVYTKVFGSNTKTLFIKVTNRSKLSEIIPPVVGDVPGGSKDKNGLTVTHKGYLFCVISYNDTETIVSEPIELGANENNFNFSEDALNNTLYTLPSPVGAASTEAYAPEEPKEKIYFFNKENNSLLLSEFNIPFNRGMNGYLTYNTDDGFNRYFNNNEAFDFSELMQNNGSFEWGVWNSFNTDIISDETKTVVTNRLLQGAEVVVGSDGTLGIGFVSANALYDLTDGRNTAFFDWGQAIFRLKRTIQMGSETINLETILYVHLDIESFETKPDWFYQLAFVEKSVGSMIDDGVSDNTSSYRDVNGLFLGCFAVPLEDNPYLRYKENLTFSYSYYYTKDNDLVNSILEGTNRITEENLGLFTKLEDHDGSDYKIQGSNSDLLAVAISKESGAHPLIDAHIFACVKITSPKGSQTAFTHRPFKFYLESWDDPVSGDEKDSAGNYYLRSRRGYLDITDIVTTTKVIDNDHRTVTVKYGDESSEKWTYSHLARKITGMINDGLIDINWKIIKSETTDGLGTSELVDVTTDGDVLSNDIDITGTNKKDLTINIKTLEGFKSLGFDSDNWFAKIRPEIKFNVGSIPITNNVDDLIHGRNTIDQTPVISFNRVNWNETTVNETGNLKLVYFTSAFIREDNEYYSFPGSPNKMKAGKLEALVQCNHPLEKQAGTENVYRWYVSPTNTLDIETATQLTDINDTGIKIFGDRKKTLYFKIKDKERLADIIPLLPEAGLDKNGLPVTHKGYLFCELTQTRDNNTETITSKPIELGYNQNDFSIQPSGQWFRTMSIVSGTSRTRVKSYVNGEFVFKDGKPVYIDDQPGNDPLFSKTDNLLSYRNTNIPDTINVVRNGDQFDTPNVYSENDTYAVFDYRDLEKVDGPTWLIYNSDGTSTETETILKSKTTSNAKVEFQGDDSLSLTFLSTEAIYDLTEGKNSPYSHDRWDFAQIIQLKHYKVYDEVLEFGNVTYFYLDMDSFDNEPIWGKNMANETSNLKLVFFDSGLIREIDRYYTTAEAPKYKAGDGKILAQFNHTLDSSASNVTYKWYISPTNTLDTSSATLLNNRQEGDAGSGSLLKIIGADTKTLFIRADSITDVAKFLPSVGEGTTDKFGKEVNYKGYLFCVISYNNTETIVSEPIELGANESNYHLNVLNQNNPYEVSVKESIGGGVPGRYNHLSFGKNNNTFTYTRLNIPYGNDLKFDFSGLNNTSAVDWKICNAPYPVPDEDESIVDYISENVVSNVEDNGNLTIKFLTSDAIYNLTKGKESQNNSDWSFGYVYYTQNFRIGDEDITLKGASDFVLDIYSYDTEPIWYDPYAHVEFASFLDQGFKGLFLGGVTLGNGEFIAREEGVTYEYSYYLHPNSLAETETNIAKLVKLTDVDNGTYKVQGSSTSILAIAVDRYASQIPLQDYKGLYACITVTSKHDVQKIFSNLFKINLANPTSASDGQGYDGDYYLRTAEGYRDLAPIVASTNVVNGEHPVITIKYDFENSSNGSLSLFKRIWDQISFKWRINKSSQESDLNNEYPRDVRIDGDIVSDDINVIGTSKDTLIINVKTLKGFQSLNDQGNEWYSRIRPEIKFNIGSIKVTNQINSLIRHRSTSPTFQTSAIHFSPVGFTNPETVEQPNEVPTTEPKYVENTVPTKPTTTTEPSSGDTSVATSDEVRFVRAENLSEDFIIDRERKTVRVNFPPEEEDKLGIQSMEFDDIEKKVKWVNGDGSRSEYDFSNFLVDIHVTAANYENGILTLVQENGTNVTVDLNSLGRSITKDTSTVTVTGDGSESNPLTFSVKFDTTRLKTNESGAISIDYDKFSNDIAESTNNKWSENIVAASRVSIGDAFGPDVKATLFDTRSYYFFEITEKLFGVNDQSRSAPTLNDGSDTYLLNKPVEPFSEIKVGNSDWRTLFSNNNVRSSVGKSVYNRTEPKVYYFDEGDEITFSVHNQGYLWDLNDQMTTGSIDQYYIDYYHRKTTSFVMLTKLSKVGQDPYTGMETITRNGLQYVNGKLVEKGTVENQNYYYQFKPITMTNELDGVGIHVSWANYFNKHDPRIGSMAEESLTPQLDTRTEEDVFELHDTRLGIEGFEENPDSPEKHPYQFEIAEGPDGYLYVNNSGFVGWLVKRRAIGRHELMNAGQEDGVYFFNKDGKPLGTPRYVTHMSKNEPYSFQVKLSWFINDELIIHTDVDSFEWQMASYLNGDGDFDEWIANPQWETVTNTTGQTHIEYYVNGLEAETGAIANAYENDKGYRKFTSPVEGIENIVIDPSTLDSNKTYVYRYRATVKGGKYVIEGPAVLINRGLEADAGFDEYGIDGSFVPMKNVIFRENQRLIIRGIFKRSNYQSDGVSASHKLYVNRNFYSGEWSYAPWINDQFNYHYSNGTAQFTGTVVSATDDYEIVEFDLGRMPVGASNWKCYIESQYEGRHSNMTTTQRKTYSNYFELIEENRQDKCEYYIYDYHEDGERGVTNKVGDRMLMGLNNIEDKELTAPYILPVMNV